MRDDLQLGSLLLAWRGCRIRADLLSRIRAVYARTDPREVADLDAVVEKALRGMELLTVDDLPPKLKRSLKL
jgi:hypothetical protein